MTQKLERPLDFAAVTDHSEFFGEMTLCFDEESPAYHANSCKFLRGETGEGLSPFIRAVISENPGRVTDICGEDGSDCLEASLSLWQSTRDMAEEAYDRTSDCSFTTFVGYEYTGTPRSNNYHRNVIFRNDRVPEHAISYIEAPTDVDLWDQLTEQCLEGVEGCDVLAIPHNSNLSSGAMFPSYISRFESSDTARETAELRNAMEPLMEVFQHKGNSECFNGLPNILGAEDELCEQEQVRSVGRQALSFAGEPTVVRFCEEGEIGIRGFVRFGCISKNDFFRSVLLTGLQDEAVIGVNSYKMGVIASTDGHISTAGDTHEHGWPGHLAPETDFETRLSDRGSSPFGLNANPGGLAGVWAVENSRDAIFESLRRKEVFGTTGTRIRPRLFAGWDFAEDACGMDDRAAHGYAAGIPMGGDLNGGPAGASPQLLVSAIQDPDAAQLQKLQVIKGWVDDGRPGALQGLRRRGRGKPGGRGGPADRGMERQRFRVAVRPVRGPRVRSGRVLVLLPQGRGSAHAALELGPVHCPAPRRASGRLRQRCAEDDPGNGLDVADLVPARGRRLARILRPMKIRTKNALLVFHRWSGISAGLIIVLVGVTGSILVFEDELDVALNPDLYTAEPDGLRLPLDEITSQLPGPIRAGSPPLSRAWTTRRAERSRLRFVDAGGNERQVFVNPFTAEIVGERSSLSSLALIRRLHGDLTLGAIGENALGLLAILLMAMFTVGLMLWWPRKERLPEALSVKWDGGSRRVIRDLHNAGGVYMFVFLFLSAVTVPPIVWKLTAPAVGPPASTAAPPTAAGNAAPRMQAGPGGPPPSIPWQDAADAALEAVPDSWLGFILRPLGPQPFYLIRVFPPGENAVAKQTTVFVNRYTGEIIRLSAPAAPTWMSLLSADFAASLHSGAIAGLPGRWVMFIAGLFFPALFATGFLLVVAQEKGGETALALRLGRPPVLDDSAHDGVGQVGVVPLGAVVERWRAAGAQDDKVLRGHDVDDLVGVAVEEVEVGGEVGFAVQDLRHAAVRVGEAAPLGIPSGHPDAQAEIRVLGRGRDHFLHKAFRQDAVSVPQAVLEHHDRQPEEVLGRRQHAASRVRHAARTVDPDRPAHGADLPPDFRSDKLRVPA